MTDEREQELGHSHSSPAAGDCSRSQGPRGNRAREGERCVAQATAGKEAPAGIETRDGVDGSDVPAGPHSEDHAAKLLFVLAQERLGGPCVPAGQSAAAIEEGALAFSDLANVAVSGHCKYAAGN